MSSQSIAPGIPVKPLMGKYDGRRRKSVQSGRGGTRINAGRKPNHVKHLAKNTAAYLFRECDFKARCVELLSSKDERLRFEVIRYVWDRLEGKPFVAENPNAKAGPSALQQDNRLQLAIKNLVVSPPEKSKRKSKAVNALEAKQLEAPTIQAEIVTSPGDHQDIDNK